MTSGTKLLALAIVVAGLLIAGGIFYAATPTTCTSGTDYAGQHTSRTCSKDWPWK